MARRSQHEALTGPTTQIRDAAKWLVGGLAAVGTLLVAGSQLSSLGKLKLESPLSGETWTSLETARLWIAVIGLTLALGSLLWALRSTLSLLVPQEWPLRAIEAEHEKPGSPSRKFLDANPEYLAPYASPKALRERQEALEKERETRRKEVADAPEAGRAAAEARLLDTRRQLAAVYRDAESLGALVSYVTLKSRFSLSKRWIFAMAVAVGLGTLAFAWAANPPEDAGGAKLAGADLQGAVLRAADLQKADLTGADLRDADLQGAKLEGATLTGVVWGRTRCPDGRMSDDVGGTCDGHLRP